MRLVRDEDEMPENEELISEQIEGGSDPLDAVPVGGNEAEESVGETAEGGSSSQVVWQRAPHCHVANVCPRALRSEHHAR